MIWQKKDITINTLSRKQEKCLAFRAAWQMQHFKRQETQAGLSAQNNVRKSFM